MPRSSLARASVVPRHRATRRKCATGILSGNPCFPRGLPPCLGNLGSPPHVQIICQPFSGSVLPRMLGQRSMSLTRCLSYARTLFDGVQVMRQHDCRLRSIRNGIHARTWRVRISPAALANPRLDQCPLRPPANINTGFAVMPGTAVLPMCSPSSQRLEHTNKQSFPGRTQPPYFRI